MRIELVRRTRSRTCSPHCSTPRFFTAVALGWTALTGPGLQAEAPLLTGVVADGDSQQIIMPRLPGTWMRTIAWMAPEGEWVEEGSVVIRLDPDNLITNEEDARIALEQKRLEVKRSQVQRELDIHNARTEVVRAESAVLIARVDAEIPEDIQTGLTYEQSQLALLNAENALQRAQDELATQLEYQEMQAPVQRQQIEQADLEWRRTTDALSATEIRAVQSGVMIYGENESTGTKIFPGETCAAGTLLATVARREALRFQFWIHEADIQHIRPGTILRVTADARADFDVEAEVDWVSLQATPRTGWGEAGHFEAMALPLEPVPEELSPGMSIMAEVLTP